MTDLERRLRAALRAAAEPAPPGLLDAVMRRHRRHRIRVGASVLAVLAAAALAVPPVTSALSGDGMPGGGAPPVRPGGGLASNPLRVVFTRRSPTPSRPATPIRSATPSRPATPTRSASQSQGPGPQRRPVAAAGTVLSGCGGANLGALGRNWQALPYVKAGPLWFLADGHSSGPVRLYVAVAVLDGLRPGSVVVARVAPAGRPYLRFLYGPSDSLNPGTRYTARSGEPGVTFVACPQSQQIVPSPRITDYYGGYLVKGARCVPVRVWVPGRAGPILIHLGSCPGR
ncbi:MAG TPA: hypothetical protein VMU94_05985 [Streptosporangiaceae bacterium]|nr:hypothetical protein [Streptosporangiaceae bacterium]